MDPSTVGIHAALALLMGTPYTPTPAPVIGWGSTTSPSAPALASFLGVPLGEERHYPDLPPYRQDQVGAWPAAPNQVGYMDIEQMLPQIDPSGSAPPLSFVYSNSAVKGLEGYFASPPGTGPVNEPQWLDGTWVPYDSPSMVLNLNPERGLAEALESYGHQWEHSLREYAPHLWDRMKEEVGTIHTPVGREGDYNWGDEGGERYLKRWLTTAAEMVYQDQMGQALDTLPT